MINRRRLYGRIVAVAMFALLLTGVGQSQAATQWPSAWPKFRLQQDNNAVWNTEGATAAKWKTHLDGTTLLTDATLVNGVVYMGAEEKKVIALDATSGAVLWKTEVGNRIRGQMVVANGKVFVGTGNRDFKRDYAEPDDEQQVLIRGRGDNAMYALDEASGKVLWQFATVGENMPTPYYRDGALYFANGDRHFYALDAATGTLLWKLRTPSYDSVSSLNFVGDRVFFGGADPNIFISVDIKARAFGWQTDTHVAEVGGIDDCSPAYADGLLFTDSVTRINADGTYGGHGIYAINADSGKFVWTFDEGDGAMIENNKCGVPVVVDGVVYAGSPVTRAMYALDAKTGKLLWKIGNTDVIKGPPVVYDGRIYFVNIPGLLYAADANNGNIIKIINLGGKTSTQGPMIANGSIYIGTQKGDMFAIPLNDLK